MEAPNRFGNGPQQPTFSTRFSELLDEHGLTPSTFTKLVYDTTAGLSDEQKRLGVWISEGTQGNWLRRGSRTEPRGRTLTVIAQVLRVQPNYLLGRSDVRVVDEVQIDVATAAARRKKRAK